MTKTNTPWIKLLLAGLVLLAASSISARAADPVVKPKPGTPPPPPVGSQYTSEGQR